MLCLNSADWRLLSSWGCFLFMIKRSELYNACYLLLLHLFAIRPGRVLILLNLASVMSREMMEELIPMTDAKKDKDQVEIFI